MVIMAPSDARVLHTGYHYQDGPCAVRYPRGTGTGAELQPLSPLPIGKVLFVAKVKKSLSYVLAHY